MHFADDHLSGDQLALIALGDAQVIGPVADHLATCTDCRSALSGLTDVVMLGRQTQEVYDLPAPPARVWDGIVRQIGHPANRSTSRWPRSSRRRPDALTGSRSRRTQILRAAALTIVCAAVAAAAVIGVLGRTSPSAHVISRAPLVASANAPVGARGTAEIVRSGDAVQLRLTLLGMPPPAGYYEAWLFDPHTGTMYPMGPLSVSGGTVTVTGIDLTRYTGVDISAQSLDDKGAHGTSMLSGMLQH